MMAPWWGARVRLPAPVSGRDGLVANHLVANLVRRAAAGCVTLPLEALELLKTAASSATSKCLSCSFSLHSMLFVARILASVSLLVMDLGMQPSPPTSSRNLIPNQVAAGVAMALFLVVEQGQEVELIK